MKYFIFTILFLFSQYSSAQQGIIYIDYTATGNGSGDSWENAKTKIIFNFFSNEVWLAKGTYYVYDDVDSEISNQSFICSDSLKLYGGFAGNETSIDQRDIAANPTILDGDLGIKGDSTDNTQTILRSSSNPVNYLSIDGITFQNGKGVFPPSDGHDVYAESSGIMYVEGVDSNSVIEMRNCTFRNNSSRYGASIYLKNITPIIENCEFYENDGAPIIIAEGIMKNCHFHHNSAMPFFGGVIDSCRFDHLANEQYLSQYGPNLSGEISNCTFENNKIYGAVFSVNSKVKNCEFKNNWRGIFYKTFNGEHSLENCSISNNEDSGILIYGLITDDGDSNKVNITNCIFDSNDKVLFQPENPGWETANYVTITNTLIKNQRKNLFDFTTQEFKINNSVFYNNTAADSIGIINSVVDTVEIYNSIFYNNSSGKGDVFATNSILKNNLFESDDCENFEFPEYTLVWNYDSKSYDSISMHSLQCQNNIFNSNPEFKDPESNDFNLKICSPAINMGYNPIIDSLGLALDYQGNPRIQGAVVDMGIYEYEYNEIAFDTIIQDIDTDHYKGSILIENIKHGNAPYSFVWEDGNTNAYRDTLDMGTYSLSITDADGCEFVYEFEISDLTSTTNLLADLDINIYPNPIQFGQKLNINYNAQSVSANISIFDFTGRLVSKEQYNLIKRQNLLDVPKGRGVYLLKIEFEDGRFGFEKLIVQ